VGKYRIILADDHALFRKGLKRTLEEDGDIEVLGEAGDGLELLGLLKKWTPDLIILDISMPNLRGIESIPEVKKLHPDVRILVVTMHGDKQYLYQAMSAGADGYFLKKDTDKELFSAIEKIRRGTIYVSPHFAEELPGNWEEVSRQLRKPILTTREIEILKLIADGKSNQEIAGLLFISVYTVQRHRANIMEKLQIRGTAELVRHAIEKKYI
jgi:DNA-binding NarL/FixJ family response regulator